MDIASQSIILAVVLGVVCYTFSRRVQMPAILFYLIIGMAGGPLGFNLLQVREFPDALRILSEATLAIILFEGGLSLSIRGFQKAPASIGRLLLLSIPLTAVGGLVCAHYILDLSWDVAGVFGTIIVVTGPTVIGPLLKTLNLSHRVEVLLHWESIWGDVSGTILSAMALQFVFVTSLTDIGNIALVFMSTILSGSLTGLLAGYLLDRFILPWVLNIQDRQLPGIIAFASALGIFFGAELLMKASGPMAAAVAGFFLSHQRAAYLHRIRQFKSQISVLFISTLFILLSAYINPFAVLDRWPHIFATALALGIIVRPLSVFLALTGTRTSWREKAYVSVIGPRGIVALAAASYASFAISGRSGEMALLLNTTFIIIFLSGSVATLLGKPLAFLLGIMVPKTRTGILLVGTTPFSLKLAEFMKDYIPLSFLETNIDTCRFLENQAINNMCTELLDDNTYEEATEEGFYRLIALTTDDSLNQLICQKAAFHLGGANVYATNGSRKDYPILSEPIHAIKVAFSDHFFLLEALEKIERNQAVFRIFDEYPTDRPDVIPLFKITDDQGLIVFSPEVPKEGKIVGLIYEPEAGSAAHHKEINHAKENADGNTA